MSSLRFAWFVVPIWSLSTWMLPKPSRLCGSPGVQRHLKSMQLALLGATDEAACDAHFRQLLARLKPQWVIWIGGFAEARAVLALSGVSVSLKKVLHPSPASSAANRGWAEAASRQMTALGIW